MNRNMGTIDRILRGILGVGLLTWALLGRQEIHLLGWLGVIPLGTALFGFCPLYRLLGLNTCGADRTSDKTS